MNVDQKENIYEVLIPAIVNVRIVMFMKKFKPWNTYISFTNLLSKMEIIKVVDKRATGAKKMTGKYSREYQTIVFPMTYFK